MLSTLLTVALYFTPAPQPSVFSAPFFIPGAEDVLDSEEKDDSTADADLIEGNSKLLFLTSELEPLRAKVLLFHSLFQSRYFNTPPPLA